jgi:hypothetical protein
MRNNNAAYNICANISAAQSLQENVSTILDFIAGFPSGYCDAVAERLPGHIREEVERIAWSDDELNRPHNEPSASPLLRLIHDDANGCLNLLLGGTFEPTAEIFTQIWLSITAGRVEKAFKSQSNVVALPTKA